MYEENNCRNRISLYEIQQSGCKLLGTVLNRADVKGRAYGKYGYGKYNRVEYGIGQILANSI